MDTRSEDYNITIIDLPRGVHACTRANEDGSYSILLNARDAWERRVAACSHELEHIAHEDFDPGDVQVMEARAHYG